MAIFKKSDYNVGSEVVPAPKVERNPTTPTRNVSVIGSTLVFKGELSADEDLIIEGHVEGTIAHHKKHLTVGEKGRVKADIHASSVIVLGQLIGDIHSEGTVTLSKGADVRGNIFCGHIVMEEGARFKGEIDMGEAPKTTAPKEPVPTETIRKDQPGKVEGQTAKASIY